MWVGGLVGRVGELLCESSESLLRTAAWMAVVAAVAAVVPASCQLGLLVALVAADAMC